MGGAPHLWQGRRTLCCDALSARMRDTTRAALILAMMKLFGGFSARCFSAYNAVYPLASGYEERLPLYQLYPLLVHVNLFGGHYAQSVRQVLKRHT